MNPINSTMFPTRKPGFLLEHSWWDLWPVALGCLHLAFQVFLLLNFHALPWWALIPLGFLYSYMIAWNIESVAHNFTHIDYFQSAGLNRAFSVVLSLAIGFSQEFYKTVHRRHHIGNSDQIDPATGKTRDWFSIYARGKDGRPESAWSYCLFGFFRGEADEVYADMRKSKNGETNIRWAKFEDRAHWVWLALLGIVNWHFLLFFLPFYYLGHVFSMMVGYYEHYQANPDLPIAWGVSTYTRLYNFLWMNNGYHAEHHYRPRIHWTQMKRLREAIHENDQSGEIHVIRYSHLLGFIDARRNARRGNVDSVVA